MTRAPVSEFRFGQRCRQVERQHAEALRDPHVLCPQRWFLSGGPCLQCQCVHRRVSRPQAVVYASVAATNSSKDLAEEILKTLV